MSDPPKTAPEVAELASEALRHLLWLRDSGVREVEPAAPRPAPPTSRTPASFSHQR